MNCKSHKPILYCLENNKQHLRHFTNLCKILAHCDFVCKNTYLKKQEGEQNKKKAGGEIGTDQKIYDRKLGYMAIVQ